MSNNDIFSLTSYVVPYMTFGTPLLLYKDLGIILETDITWTLIRVESLADLPVQILWLFIPFIFP